MESSRTRRRFAAVCAVGWSVLSGCNDGPLGPATAIAVRNATADTIAVYLWDLEASHLVDPLPEGPAASYGNQVILPGGQRLVQTTEIAGYRPGKDLRIFIYRIRGERSVFERIQDASARTLRARGFVVEIPAIF